MIVALSFQSWLFECLWASHHLTCVFISSLVIICQVLTVALSWGQILSPWPTSWLELLQWYWTSQQGGLCLFYANFTFEGEYHFLFWLSCIQSHAWAHSAASLIAHAIQICSTKMLLSVLCQQGSNSRRSCDYLVKPNTFCSLASAAALATASKCLKPKIVQ